MPVSKWVQIRENTDIIKVIGRSGKKAHLIPPVLFLLGIFLIFSFDSNNLRFGIGILSFIATAIVGVIVLSTTNLDIIKQSSTVTSYIKYFGLFRSVSKEYDLQKIYKLRFDYSGVSGRKNVSDQYFTLFFEDGRSNHAFLWGNPTQLWYVALRLRELLSVPIHIKIAHPDRIIEVDQLQSEWLPDRNVDPNPSLLKGTLDDGPNKRVIMFKVNSIPGILALVFIFSPVLYYSYRILSSEELFQMTGTEGFFYILIAVVAIMLFVTSALLNFSPGYIELTPNNIGIGVRTLGIPIIQKIDIQTLIHCFVTDKIKSGHRIFVLSSQKGLMTVPIADVTQANLIINLFYQFYQSI